jgi:hypothetical protein
MRAGATENAKADIDDPMAERARCADAKVTARARSTVVSVYFGGQSSSELVLASEALVDEGGLPFQRATA